MKAFQLITAISPALQKEILNHIFTNHKAAFRMVQNQLAQARKLRPVFLQSKSREEQYKWLLEQMSLKSHDPIAEQVLQLWLLKGQQPMLAAFLDALGVEHKDGEVEGEFPEDISEAKAAKAIDAVLKDYPAENVVVYLTLFQRQKEGGWPGIAAAMAKKPELALTPAAA
ncbi:MAG: hypothetical protein JNJ83_04750 [Verrucomicrobiaceae bacterium]|nr:hypothetical protein [Verrucomicrobiaceae bacterium]